MSSFDNNSCIARTLISGSGDQIEKEGVTQVQQHEDHWKSDDSNDHDNEDSDQQEEQPVLSSATLLALRQFAVEIGAIESNIGSSSSSIEGNCQCSPEEIMSSVLGYFDDPDREDTFAVNYSSSDGSRKVSFEVKGVKRELGQTLDSTGLTIWRAAEHLCEFIIENIDLFTNKTVCELGCGLGMCSIMLDKLNIARSILATDGDDDTMQLLRSNLIDCQTSEQLKAEKLYWGTGLPSFQAIYPNRFEVLIAADVIYEECQVQPLIETVVQLLEQSTTAVFILAFARRNVPMHKVLQVAQECNLRYTILDHGLHNTEPIYSFQWND